MVNFELSIDNKLLLFEKYADDAVAISVKDGN